MTFFVCSFVLAPKRRQRKESAVERMRVFEKAVASSIRGQKERSFKICAL